MSSVWKEVKKASAIARNLLAEKLLSDEKIAQVTGLSLDEVSKIKSQMKMC